MMAATARAVLDNLKARQQGGPPEEALDKLIPPLESVTTALETHVEGQGSADNTRLAQMQRLDLADNEVDRYLRHTFFYIRVESEARTGSRVEPAKLLRKATALDEMSDYINTYVPDENRFCWDVIKTLEHSDHAPAVAAIEYPMDWIPKWKAALNESQDAFNAAGFARDMRGTHAGAGRDVEGDFREIMYRLKRTVDGRADRRDKVKVAEGKALIQPLLDAEEKARTDAAARATRRENEAPKIAPPVQGAPAEQTGTSGNE
jgi:hypothetical protein